LNALRWFNGKKGFETARGILLARLNDPDRAPDSKGGIGYLSIRRYLGHGRDKWLHGTLDAERRVMIPWFEKKLGQLGHELLDLIKPALENFKARISALELKPAKLDGAVDVLRGKEPPVAKFPAVKAWREGKVYHEDDVVTFASGCFQARCDTARAPDGDDWICLARPGNSVTLRGAYDEHTDYRYLDVTMINGSSFVALQDDPGACPGADWRLIASRGSRGAKGMRGFMGPKGERGERGQAAASIRSWQIDRARYAATPIMSDGSAGPELPLRELFEHFLSEVGDASA
jgi:hypothetical protein